MIIPPVPSFCILPAEVKVFCVSELSSQFLKVIEEKGMFSLRSQIKEASVGNLFLKNHLTFSRSPKKLNNGYLLHLQINPWTFNGDDIL